MEVVMKEQTPLLARWLGTIGLVTGFIIGWNATQNFWAAAICALIVACLGAYIGKVLHQILVIAASVVIAIGSSYVRSTVTGALVAGIRESQQQSQTVKPLTSGATSSSAKSQRAATLTAKVIKTSNLRPKPSADNDPDNTPLMQMEIGDRLEVQTREYVGNGWYRVKHYGTGREGWVSGYNIEFE